MAKGTALFDTVAISDTFAANVRAGLVRRCEPCRMRVGAGAGGRGVASIAMERAASAVQDGGVVSMYDGAVTFKGGTISNTKAVRARPLRLHIPHSHVPNIHAFCCIAAHDAACHVVWALGDTLHARCCTLQCAVCAMWHADGAQSAWYRCAALHAVLCVFMLPVLTKYHAVHCREVRRG
jgi:hypothetical protein